MAKRRKGQAGVIEEQQQQRAAARPASATAPAPAGREGALGAALGRLSRPGQAMLLIVLLAASLRLVGIAHRPLWLDELWSAEVATGRGSVHLTLPNDRIVDSPPATTHLDGAPPAWRVWTSLESVTHPPLYFVVLRLWREAFGESDIAGRMLSVLASLAALLLLFDAARRLNGTAVALWACGLMAVAPPQVLSGNEVRNYALLLALGTGGMAALVRVETLGPNARRAAALALCTAAMLLTHYFAGGAVLALLAYALVRLRGRARVTAAGAILAGGAVFLATWAPFLLEHARAFAGGDATTDFLARPRASLLRHALAVAVVPVRQLADYAALAPGQRGVGAVMFAGSAVAGAAVFLAPLAVVLRRGRSDLLLPALWLWGTVGLVAALDVTRSTGQLEYVRYTLLAAPAVFVLIPALASRLPWWRARAALPVVAVAVCLAGMGKPYARTAHSVFSWNAYAALFEQIVRPHDVLVIAAPGWPAWLPNEAYLGLSHYTLTPMPRVVLLRNAPAPPALRDELARAGRVWLFCFYVEGSRPDPQTLVPGFDAEVDQLDIAPTVLWHLTPATEDATR